MDPHGPRASCRAVGGDVRTVRVHVVPEGLDETLARSSDEDGVSDLREARQFAQDLPALVARQREAEARVYHNFISCHTSINSVLNLGPHALDERAHKVFPVVEVLPRHARQRAVVLDDVRAARLRNSRVHLGIPAPAAHIVDDRRTRARGLAGRRRMQRIHRHDDAVGGQGLDDGADARPLLVCADARRVRAGRLPAHVDEVRTGGHHLAGVAQRGRDVRVASPVRERIGGHVEDAHDRRPTGRQGQVTGQRQGRDRGRGRGGGQGQVTHVIGSRTGRGPSSRRGSRRRS